MPRREWSAVEVTMVKYGAVLVLGGKSIYSTVKMLMDHPALYGRSWESVRQRLNRQRALDSGATAELQLVAVVEATMKVRLCVSDGGFVVSGAIPPFVMPPDVIVWGTRIFKLHEVTPDYVEYREAFYVALIDTDPA